ncbi:MarR family transcriptional regulator [Ralstonia pseudosolanacearum]|uniref:MarR family transcriptional regulator n=1 Tax=Ralstonia pseudosolanacearum TaxID=1310165 RepID=UPI001FFC22DE|nr:MarR family transcriptional regulator [Ralstonia pseudosolanacearum]
MTATPGWSALQLALLAALQETEAGRPVSLPWLTKRVGERGSTVLRALHPLADAGLLRVTMDDTRWLVVLSDAGRHAHKDAAA